MKFRLDKLELVCRRSTEVVPFTDFTYFYGEIGAGKSTIARLIDYCLGGRLVETPALQREFVSASLHVFLDGTPAVLTRPRNSNQIEALWGTGDDEHHAVVPARKATGTAVPGTDIEGKRPT